MPRKKPEWIEAWGVMIFGKIDGVPVSEATEPFRSSDDALRWAKRHYPRYRRNIYSTFVDPTIVRWRRAPKRLRK